MTFLTSTTGILTFSRAFREIQVQILETTPDERRRSEWFSVKATNKEKRRINELNRFGLEIRLPVLARENQQRSFISDAETSKEVFIKYHLMPSRIHIIWFSDADVTRYSHLQRLLLSINEEFRVASRLRDASDEDPSVTTSVYDPTWRFANINRYYSRNLLAHLPP